jgi:hypothetical protein
VELSDAALERLATNGAAAAFGGSTVTADGKTAIAIGVGWAVVCIVIGETEPPIDVIVQDTSGLPKI